METVSIIIPVYNTEKYVERCIRSVLEQSYGDLEIIVIDDGSTDRSGEILDGFAEKDGRIKVFHQANRGVSAARNFGVKKASGAYLTFVDGDDYLGPHYIRDLVARAQEEQADMVICGFTLTEENGRALRAVKPGRYERFVKEEWVCRISAAWAHLYRRTLWDTYQAAFFEGVRGEDMPISLLFSAVCDKICTLCRADYYYVQHPESAMQNFRGLKRYRLPYQALEETIRKVQETGVKNSGEYFELFVLRILATCLFQLGRGAKAGDMRELTDYIVRILTVYFPRYYKNRLAGLFSPIEAPFSQKAAVWLLVLLVRTGLIYPASALLR